MAFNSKAVLGIIAKFLGENILNVSPASNILMVSNPGLWIKALEFSPRTDLTSHHISKLMATFCNNKADTLDLETLHRLWRGEFMSNVDPDAVMAMCALEDRLQEKMSDPQTELSHLQQRCADSLLSIRQSLATPDATTVKFLLERKPSFLVDLLLKSWKAAADTQKLQHELSTAQAELRKSQAIIILQGKFEVNEITRVDDTLIEQMPSAGPCTSGVLTYQDGYSKKLPYLATTLER